MGSMVDCKIFFIILYLIKQTENYTMYTYQKGVMATSFGEENIKKITSKKERLKTIKTLTQ